MCICPYVFVFPDSEENHLLYTVTIHCQIYWADLFVKVFKFHCMIRTEYTPVKAMFHMRNRLCMDQKTSKDIDVVI